MGLLTTSLPPAASRTKGTPNLSQKHAHHACFCLSNRAEMGVDGDPGPQKRGHTHVSSIVSLTRWQGNTKCE